MASVTGSSSRFKVKAPEKGSFPIDHEGICKQYMINYMKCLKSTKDDASSCRKQSMEYLACRMDNNLMDRDSWRRLGYADLAKETGTEERT